MARARNSDGETPVGRRPFPRYNERWETRCVHQIDETTKSELGAKAEVSCFIIASSNAYFLDKISRHYAQKADAAFVIVQL
jgi:hypothetical protein